ncbi:class I SAM-dependent methyltransferase [Trujillonella humicola]|uniref:class I SAM-dependent methyltransferase n=1 Tax=Trujillonella humicola TaxID=3383699 RepID=UPI0039061D65
MRDLDDYGTRYRHLPFEPLQAAYRRRRVLDRVAAHRPGRLLEVGCAEAPLFLDLPGQEMVVVEPTPVFADGARRQAAGRPEVTVVEALLEDASEDALGGPFDMVVVSGLLHEVPDPDRLLRTVRRTCRPGGVVHVNVPSAGSLHRLLAVAMGLIPAADARSDNQRLLQQRTVYDVATLERELAEAGLRVVARGSILVKPFSHAQMQQLVDSGFLTGELLDGLDRLTGLLPDLGSEIWVDAEPADG